MSVTIKGPQTEIEYEATKKLITEKEIKSVLLSESSKMELRRTKTQIRELLGFYDRIIKSIDYSIRNIKSNNQLSNQQKQIRYLNQQERDLSKSKSEKSKFRRYLKKIDEKLNES